MQQQSVSGSSELSEHINGNLALDDSSLFSSPVMDEQYVDCSEGTLRVLHFKPHRAGGERPVVFVPGWGTSPEVFTDFFRMISGKVECYYVETREKNSSRRPAGGVPMDMDQNADDLAAVIDHLQLTDNEYILIGTCWGATIVGHALVKHVVDPGDVVLYDPMPRLWFPKWLLNIVVPVIPVMLWKLLLPLGRLVALWGMKEETQRRRAHAVITNADLKKWRQAALAIGDYDLELLVPQIDREICVFTGVPDKIHGQDKYPSFTRVMPQGHLFVMCVDESQRESLLGLIAREFACRKQGNGVPQLFRGYEVDVRNG